jgi:hypothetical protein
VARRPDAAEVEISAAWRRRFEKLARQTLRNFQGSGPFLYRVSMSIGGWYWPSPVEMISTGDWYWPSPVETCFYRRLVLATACINDFYRRFVLTTACSNVFSNLFLFFKWVCINCLKASKIHILRNIGPKLVKKKFVVFLLRWSSC